VAVVLPVLLLSILFDVSCRQTLEPLRIGVVALEGSVPILVAREEGFYERNGLGTETRSYAVGTLALRALMEGEVDVAAGPSEFALVAQALRGEQVRVFACYDKVDLLSLVCRRDRGILAVTDLAGRTIGAIKGTSIEFFLDRFLRSSGIDLGSVRIVDCGTVERLQRMMTEGTVDAVVAASPVREALVARFEDNAVVWPVQGGQPVFGLLVARKDWLESNGRRAERLLRSVAQAGDFIRTHRGRAGADVVRTAGFTTAQVTSIWSRNDYELSLDQALVAAMEDEARWMMANHPGPATHIPDLAQWIWPDALAAVMPRAVTLLR
jgi:ABC-type nitrate/sulfonate/bicarbonate transport system substrate-binding protein